MCEADEKGKINTENNAEVKGKASENFDKGLAAFPMLNTVFGSQLFYWETFFHLLFSLSLSHSPLSPSLFSPSLISLPSSPPLSALLPFPLPHPLPLPLPP